MIKSLTLVALIGLMSYPDTATLMAQEKTTEERRVIDAARQEGKVVIYTPRIDLAKLKAAFEGKYPFITVDLAYLGGVPAVKVAERFIDESDRGIKSADILMLIQSALKPVLKKAEVLAKYVPRNSQWVAADQRDAEGRWTSEGLTLFVIGYNTKRVPKGEEPKGYSDLTHPKWRSKIVDQDIRSIPRPVELLSALEKRYGEEFIRQLAKQKIHYLNIRGPEILGRVAAGEFEVTPDAGIQGAETRKRAGQPVDWVRNSDNTYFTLYTWTGIAANAPHPNAARLFVDFLFSNEGQQILADGGVSSMAPGIRFANPDMSPRGKKLITVEPLAEADLKAFRDKYVALFFP